MLSYEPWCAHPLQAMQYGSAHVWGCMQPQVWAPTLWGPQPVGWVVPLQPPWSCSDGRIGSWHSAEHIDELLTLQSSDSDDSSTHNTSHPPSPCGSSSSTSRRSSLSDEASANEAGTCQHGDTAYGVGCMLSPQASYSPSFKSSSSGCSSAGLGTMSPRGNNTYGTADTDCICIFEDGYDYGFSPAECAGTVSWYSELDSASQATLFVQNLYACPGAVAGSPQAAYLLDMGLDACLCAAAEFRNEREAAQCCISLCTDPLFQGLATVERVIASVEVIAMWHAACESASGPLFLSDALVSAFVHADWFLRKNVDCFNSETLLVWLQVCRQLRAGSWVLHTGSAKWVQDTVDKMTPAQLVLALAACGFLQMRDCWLTGAILQRLQDLLTDHPPGTPPISRLSHCLWAQLAHAVALLRAKDYLELCLTAVSACSDTWGRASTKSFSMLGRVDRFFEHCCCNDFRHVLSESQLEAIGATCRAQGLAVRPSFQQRHIHQLLTDGLHSSFWRTPPTLEKVTESGATTMDIHCVTQSGMQVAIQFEGPQHYVEWFDMGAEDGPAAVSTLRLNGGTTFRNEDQAYEGLEVISICCAEFRALGRGVHTQVEYLLQRLQVAEAGHAAGKALTGLCIG